MLAILATHPIQYQVPLWQRLARDGTVPFEVWYLSQHATTESRDREFGKNFAWDIDMLEGYPHRFLTTPAGSSPNTPFRSRIAESLPDLFRQTQANILWVQGWQVAAYWQTVWAAKREGLEVWLRGESNNLAPTPAWKRAIKRPLLGQFFRRVDEFLCIGSANCGLYRGYGVPESKLHLAPYAVDNERFGRQADALRGQRSEIRREWGIRNDAFCILFCGKFVPKKRPMDLIEATRLLITDNSLTDNRARSAQLLFVGSGELGDEMRKACDVVFDAESGLTSDHRLPRRSQAKAGPLTTGVKPPASFAGFLNQTEISRAYVAADVLVLPSDFGETWGLVVNEAMASGLRCVISDHCGCAPDLGPIGANAVYNCGDVNSLTHCLGSVPGSQRELSGVIVPSFQETLATVKSLSARNGSN